MDKALSLSNISKKYPSGKKALNNLSFDLYFGNLVGLIGPNGAGKSTLLHIIAEVLEPSSGSIKKYINHPRELVWVSQHNCIDWYLSVLDNVRLGARLGGFSTAEAGDIAYSALSVVGLAESVNRSPDTLSIGQQKRVQIARALAQRAKILLLDEPTTGLDVIASENLMKELRSLADAGAHILVSSHDLNLIETCADHSLYIKEGNIEKKFNNLKEVFYAT